MAEPTSVQTPTPPGTPPGGVGAFVFLLTVLVSLLFIGFVLVNGYPIWIGLAGPVVMIVVAAQVLRHLYTGQRLPRWYAPRRVLPFLLKVLLKIVEQALTQDEEKPKVIPGTVDEDTDGTSAVEQPARDTADNEANSENSDDDAEDGR